MNNLILKKIILFMVAVILMKFFLNTSNAVAPDEILKNPQYELRARNISKNVRCMICQNQSIDESNAPLAKDLRILIREKIKEGNKDEEIYEFLSNRYGDFILLKPPFNSKTLFLWLLPIFFLVLGIYTIFRRSKKS